MGLSVPEGRLTRDELAFEADVSAELVDRMVAVGMLTPAPDGTFPARYVRRTAHIQGLVESGLTLDVIREILDPDFDAGDRYLPHPGRRSKQTVGQFLDSLGDRADLFRQVYAILGFSEPARDRRLRDEDETMMRRFLEAFGDDPLVAVRSARLFADGLIPLVDGTAKIQAERWAQLYPVPTPAGQAPPAETETRGNAVRVAFETANWLMKRYLERANAAADVDLLERSLAIRGLRPSPSAAHRAIVFADLTGYTALTNELGNEMAATTAVRLRDEVEPLVRTNGGRLVQLLGDGAMLHFAQPLSAIESAAQLMRDWPPDMPSLHVGIGIGPLYERDGYYFGSTVNLAARLSGAARSGQILAASVAPDQALQHAGLIPVAPLTLKGFAAPVSAFEVRLTRSALGTR